MKYFMYFYAVRVDIRGDIWETGNNTQEKCVFKCTQI